MAGNFPSPNEVFEDRYRIVSIINRGGFGRVYRAQQVELHRDVAIKVLQPITRDGVDAEEQAERLEVVKKRFEREAQLVSQLRDSHTVMMHDYGTTHDGLLYMVLEYIDGAPLNQLIEERGALDPERAVKIARQVLWSLQEAHALNMLHRDVKPQNIMVFDHAGRHDLVKVLDFGLAKSAESAEFRAEDPDLTGDQVILGTPRYMSPEQIRGEALNPASDIYSLGLVMFEMLTGYKAVRGEKTMNTLARHLNDQPIVLPDDIDIPNGLRDVVDRMMLKDVDDRLQSAEEVLDALEFWNASTSVLGGSDSDPVGGAPVFLEERRKQKLIWSATAVLSLFLIVAVIYAAMQEDPAQAAEIVVDEPRGSSSLGIPPKNPAPTPQPPPQEVVEVDEDELIEGEIAGGRVAKNDPPPSNIERSPSGETNGVVATPDSTNGAILAGEPPDMGTALVIDGGTIATPEEPPIDPADTSTNNQPEENKSTNSTKSGKNGKDDKKVKLKIGIVD